MQGMVQVYTGNGKGKTTAAFGLALRAVGAGKNVFIAQFVKGRKYSELKSLKEIELIEIKQYGLNYFINGKAKDADIEAAREGLEAAAEILKSGDYQLVILDEANIAVYYQLFSARELIEVIESRDPGVEVVVTGRYATDDIIEKADLVTEMKEIKHYYKKGIKARVGIEK